jgi:general secretion pathway protein G
MAIKVQCDRCANVVFADSASRGRRIMCPSCGNSLSVPGSNGSGSYRTSSASRKIDPVKRPRLVSVLAIYTVAQGLAGIASVYHYDFSPVFLMFAVLHAGVSVACAIGLWQLKPWGRVLQIVLAIIGLFVPPVVTVLSILILIYMFRADTKVRFSGLGPHRLTANEKAVLGSQPGVFDQVVSGCLIFTVALLVGGSVLMALTKSVVEPAFEDKIGSSRAKKTAADIRTLGTASEAFHVDKGHYPMGVTSMEELATHLDGTYLKSVPMADAWLRKFEVSSTENGSWIEIVSLGRDGEPDSRPGGPTTDPDADIVFRNGEFVQWPAGDE